MKKFEVFFDRFLADYYAAHPDVATHCGFHDFDSQLPDFSCAGISRDVTRLRSALSQLKRLRPSRQPGKPDAVSPQFNLDLQLTQQTLEAALFNQEILRPWEWNPNFYNERLFQAIFLLIRRDFAPLERRVQSLIERERQIPDVLRAAEKQLKNVPQMVARLAVAHCDGTINFLKHSLPRSVHALKNPEWKARFETANAGAVAAFQRYGGFIRERLLPKGRTSFALGEDLYCRKLAVDELVELPLDFLLAQAEGSLEEHEEEMKRVGALIHPRRKPDQILENMTADHPGAGRLIASTTGVLNRLRTFLRTHNIVSLPPSKHKPHDNCTVEESPECLRELTFASLDIPGPFERKANDYYYYVTLPDPRWTRAQQEQHLRFFSRHLILTTSIHEAYPGHLVHFRWVNRHPSKARRMFGAISHVEGWAHYCEQMMIEEGFGNSDPLLHLAQLHEAQMRLCRFIAGIRMHTRGMTFEQAKNLFIRGAHTQPLNAEREAKRGIVDPTYIVYTLGKMQFLRLREDLQKKWGPKFSLKRFHNNCIQNGFPPIPLLRELLLNDRRAVV
ncbi:MAG: DUF885 domain-containing protein [Acidobacteriia bacterium]|nr:DUF885 domain-containing protein [Terriglobia bacterium]